jgi:hypothetical protein
MMPYDFVFTTGKKQFIFNGKVLKFSDDDMKNYSNSGLTDLDIRTNAYHYLMSDDFLNFERPFYYSNPLPN